MLYSVLHTRKPRGIFLREAGGNSNNERGPVAAQTKSDRLLSGPRYTRYARYATRPKPTTRPKMAKEELALFITRHECEYGDGVYTWYRFARLVDVQEKHIAMARVKITSVAEYEEDAEAWGFLYADHDKVNSDEDIERGRMEAQRIFIAVTEDPSEFLNAGDFVVSKIYFHK